MRLINEIKIRGMRLAKIVDEGDMAIIANIIAMRLLQYCAEKQVERSAKEVGELEDKFLHGHLHIYADLSSTNQVKAVELTADDYSKRD